jgi:plastocyanin
MRGVRTLVLVALAGLLCNCGSSSAAHSITISNYAYSPSNQSVTPGMTITVVNNDTAIQHSLTSQAALGDTSPAP